MRFADPWVTCSLHFSSPHHCKFVPKMVSIIRRQPGRSFTTRRKHVGRRLKDQDFFQQAIFFRSPCLKLSACIRPERLKHFAPSSTTVRQCFGSCVKSLTTIFLASSASRSNAHQSHFLSLSSRNSNCINERRAHDQKQRKGCDMTMKVAELVVDVLAEAGVKTPVLLAAVA